MLNLYQWWYTFLTNYELPCKILMQVSRNRYTNQGRTCQISFFIFKMALFLVLEKKCIFTFSRKIFLRLFEVMKMTFKKK